METFIVYFAIILLFTFIGLMITTTIARNKEQQKWVRKCNHKIWVKIGDELEKEILAMEPIGAKTLGE